MKLEIGDTVIEHHNFINLFYKIKEVTFRKAVGYANFEGKEYPVEYKRRYKGEYGVCPFNMKRKYQKFDPVIREVLHANNKKK